MKLTLQQQEAIDKIAKFLSSQNNVFILRGYAGTGKTTLIPSIIEEAKKNKKKVQTMAPTGRAAKILTDKLNNAGLQEEVTTIHRGIYKFVDIKSEEKDKDDRIGERLEYLFTLNLFGDWAAKDYLAIIDEASMVSAKMSSNEILKFGSGVLLDDLMQYVKTPHGGKIIFIGDSAQLPPVGDNNSVALDDSYFIEKGYLVESFQLTDVVRQNEESLIVKNATKIRNLLLEDKNSRNYLQFAIDNKSVVDLPIENVVSQYGQNQDGLSLDESVIITYTNSNAGKYNRAVRKKLYNGDCHICPGDILIVVANSYLMDCIVLNGEFAQVVSASDIVDSLTAPVYVPIGAKTEKKEITLTFRDVVLKLQDGKVISTKIIESLLENDYPSLTIEESKALFVNFCIRNPHLKQNSEEFKQKILQDPYYNAMRVKYGYAITGHKSQGGEWNNVIVDYSRRTGLDDDCLRWAYTATTRAKNILYGVNMPQVTPLSKMKIHNTTLVSKAPVGSVAYADMGKIDMLDSDASNARKAKFKSVQKALEQIDCSISFVQPLQYMDRYFIHTPQSEVVYDCRYNGAGVFTSFKPTNPNMYDERIIDALKSNEEACYDIIYQPKYEFLDLLHRRFSSICDELGIQITNIVNEEYAVNYHLITSGLFSYIKFYYDKSGFIKNVMPFSDKGREDDLMNKLIEKL